MIHKIWANDSRFKPIEFSKGLNVILAERSESSGPKDTRNGVGKTTLLNVLHFCLGADLNKLSLPRTELLDWSFYISIDLLGQTFVAKRSIANHKTIEIDSGINLPITPEVSPQNILYYSNEKWKRLLGVCLFNLEEEPYSYNTKYRPSFRSLISYFTRKSSDAYIDPFKYFRQQKTVGHQIDNAYLLGLNWIHASEAQVIKDKENAIKALKAAMDANMTASQGELEAKRLQLEEELKKKSDAIRSFNVHPQYKELQIQANKLTRELHTLSNESLIIKRKLDRYHQSVFEEKSTNKDTVERLFTEAGIIFSDNIKRSLKEARAFHKSIVQNRKSFLESEIIELKNLLSSKEKRIESLATDQSELLLLLKTHGALEEFSLLQERLVEKKVELESIKNEISRIREIDNHKKEIKASKIELETRLQRDYEQARSEWKKAVILFNQNSEALYDEPGNLIINVTDKGYKFDVEIQRSKSEGIGKMKIFCYDLMLVELMSHRYGVDFLFHDSTIFDAVDPRQRAHALMYAHQRGLENDFQYICTLNSDMIPKDDFCDGFTIDKFVRLTLNDKKTEDAALGFHFELSKRSKQK